MNKVILIFLMMAVTYIPRLIPFLAMRGKKEAPGGSRVRKFLSLIPFAALGALIFPGGLSSVPEMPLVSLIGLSAAGVTSWFTRNVALSVLAAVLAVFAGLSLI